jgi:hypothetical protein
VRLDGDEMAADADDGDAGDYSGTYMKNISLLDPRTRVLVAPGTARSVVRRLASVSWTGEIASVGS